MLMYEQIREKGLSITLVNGKVRLSPAKMVTEDILLYVRNHRDTLIEELEGQGLTEEKNIYELNEFNEVMDANEDAFALSGEAIKVYLPPLDADVWFCVDEKAKSGVQHEELACFLYEDLEYIRQGKPGAERLSRLFEIYARRHPITTEVLKLFNGKITSVKPKAMGKHGKDHTVSE